MTSSMAYSIFPHSTIIGATRGATNEIAPHKHNMYAINNFNKWGMALGIFLSVIRDDARKLKKVSDLHTNSPDLRSC